MRALAAILCLSVAYATGAQAGGSVWEKAPLSDQARSLIHERATAVPPFAHQDSTLADPHSWPKSMEIGGRRCLLQISSSNSEVFASHKTLATVWGGDTLNLSYLCRAGHKDLAFGPSYFWDHNGKLWRRAWTEPDTVTLGYSYHSAYDSGSLLEYFVSRRKYQPKTSDTLMSFWECFDRKGKLVGFSYRTSVGKADESQWWWDGKQLSEQDWRLARVALFESVRKRNP